MVASEGETVPKPHDLAEARQIIATLQQRLVYVEREKLHLQHELEVLLRSVFGRRSEKIDPNQLQLMLGSSRPMPSLARRRLG